MYARPMLCTQTSPLNPPLYVIIVLFYVVVKGSRALLLKPAERSLPMYTQARGYIVRVRLIIFMIHHVK